MVYGTYNELVTRANLNQLTTGGPHIVECTNQVRSLDRYLRFTIDRVLLRIFVLKIIVW